MLLLVNVLLRYLGTSWGKAEQSYLQRRQMTEKLQRSCPILLDVLVSWSTDYFKSLGYKVGKAGRKVVSHIYARSVIKS